jgi:hypothetical protein
MPSRHLLLLTLLFAPSEVLSQSISIEDLQKQIDARVSTLNPYVALLNDPDPARSRAAMELMLESGDVTLMQMAIEQGIFSPNVVVQRIALKGYFDTLPAVIIQFTGEEAANEKSFHYAVTEDLHGSVIANNGGSFTLTLDQYNPESRCYEGGLQNRNSRSGCVIVLADNGISIRVGGTHGSFQLSDGQLTGSMSLGRIINPVSARIGIGF